VHKNEQKLLLYVSKITGSEVKKSQHTWHH